LRSSMLTAAAALDMDCEVFVADDPGWHEPEGDRHHVIVLGRPLRPGALSYITQRIADMGDNIETVIQLSNEPATCVEMIVRSRDAIRLREVLVRAGDETGVDIAIEPAGWQRRAKRLVVLDVDSTLIQDEAIDLL